MSIVCEKKDVAARVSWNAGRDPVGLLWGFAHVNSGKECNAYYVNLWGGGVRTIGQ